MTSDEALKSISIAIKHAPRTSYVAELHLQIIKYAEVLQSTTGREFAEALGIGASFGTEFIKMRKIAARLREAGLDTDRI